MCSKKLRFIYKNKISETFVAMLALTPFQQENEILKIFLHINLDFMGNWHIPMAETHIIYWKKFIDYLLHYSL